MLGRSTLVTDGWPSVWYGGALPVVVRFQDGSEIQLICSIGYTRFAIAERPGEWEFNGDSDEWEVAIGLAKLRQRKEPPIIR